MNWEFYLLVGLVIWAVISVPIGVFVGWFLATGAGPDIANRYIIGDFNDENDEYYDGELSEEQKRANAKRGLADVIAYPCPLDHAGLGELCDLPSVWVCVERIKLRFDPEFEYSPYSYTREFGAREALWHPGEIGTWRETAMGNCRSGCKIYKNDVTGERALAHNSAYGCKK